MDLSEIQRAARNGLRLFEAVEPMRLSEWASANFYLSAESSYVEGAWRAYPFQTAMLDAIGNDAIREVTICKSARVGYTKMILAAIGYFAEHKRRNQGIWQPTDDDSDEFCKTELEPMFRDVPAMERVFPHYIAKDKKNTLRQKSFLGCMLHLRGGKAAKNYRRLSLDVAYIDEIDGFDLDVEMEGSPVALAAKRIEGATFPKLVIGSTPKLKHLSMIEAREQQSALRFRFHVPCPHCGAEHELTWGGPSEPHGMKWTGKDPESVRQLCPSCGVLYSQAEFLSAYDRGRWVAFGGEWIGADGRLFNRDGEPIAWPSSVGFSIWTAYSPQTTWAQIVREFLEASYKAKKGDKSELKTFVNTTLGESWEEELERADESALKKRAEDYPVRTVPRGGLVNVAGVDVQDNRFEVVVWAIGRGEEMWAVDYTVLDADPADERDWEKLDAYLQTKFDHAAGGRLGIEAVAIDTGGHFTHQAYNFARLRAGRRVFAVKGESRPGQPIKGRASPQDVNFRGAVIKRGVKLWHVGTDTAKDLFFGRLKVGRPGPGFVHFSKHLPDGFFEQITAEARVIQRTARGESYLWVKQSARNEALDCTVYALFAAHALDLNRYTERMWARLASVVEPPSGDLFDAGGSSEDSCNTKTPELTAPDPIAAPKRLWQRRKPNFANQW